MSVSDTRPGARRRPGLRRPLSAMAALATSLAAALLLPGLGLSVPSPAYADSADGRDIRTGPPGTPLAWGSNSRGQLGDGTTSAASTVPGRVCGNATCTLPLDKVVKVASSGEHNIALLDDGSVVGWGRNDIGQLGDGTTTDRITPARVCAVGEPAPCASFLKGVVSVAAGDFHSFALLTDGTMVAWGANVSGRLGDGTADTRLTPVRVCAAFTVAPCTSYLTNITSIATGFQHTLAVRSDGRVLSWGFNGNGQLGDGTTMTRFTPVVVGGGLSGVTSVAAGALHSAAVRSVDGSVVTWGVGTALGDGTGAQTTSPVPVCAIGQTAPCTSFLTGVKSVAAGNDHVLAARADGTAVAWGANPHGQIGDGTTTNRNVPVQVCAPGGCSGFLTGVSAVAGGVSGTHSLALRTDGSVRAWGANALGQLGDGTKTTRSTPVRVCALGQTAPCARFLEGVTSISAGATHSTALFRPLADLATSIGASPEPVANGGTLTYTVRVHNYGPTAAENVVLTNQLPPSARYVSASPSTGHCDTPPTGTTDTVTCSFGTLSRGGAATVTIAVKVRATVGAGGVLNPVTNAVFATSDTPDPRLNNNSAVITTPVS
ncbi:RCC1 domain-containing protein [Streptomyces sp. NPDC055721]|uniref:RCC1 domain-containing protein n=1 Tax=Streptomyces sp. NPDC127132 TaxID=3345374 RepID=UPI0036306E8A